MSLFYAGPLHGQKITVQPNDQPLRPYHFQTVWTDFGDRYEQRSFYVHDSVDTISFARDVLNNPKVIETYGRILHVREKPKDPSKP